jgi:hypothetical protein
MSKKRFPSSEALSPRKRIAQWPSAMASRPNRMYILRDHMAMLVEVSQSVY